MYERILVPLDGSQVAEVAVDYAVELARKFGSRVILLHVVPPLDVGEALVDATNRSAEVATDQAVRRFQAEEVTAEEYLANLRGRLTFEAISTDTATRVGQAADEILAYARAADALIVMTTHGHGGLIRQAPGSVAAQVASRSATPVLIIRPQP